jgi:hypothetical protein
MSPEQVDEKGEFQRILMICSLMTLAPVMSGFFYRT